MNCIQDTIDTGGRDCVAPAEGPVCWLPSVLHSVLHTVAEVSTPACPYPRRTTAEPTQKTPPAQRTARQRKAACPNGVCTTDGRCLYICVCVYLYVCLFQTCLKQETKSTRANY